MSRRKGKLPAQRSNAPCLYRQAAMDTAGARDEDRSIPLILATESAVPVFDVQRMGVVDEVLVLEGMTLPDRVPLIDSHQRDTVRSVFGSIRDLKVEDGQLVGRAYFAADDAAQQTFERYRDGHLTQFSVGAQVQEVQRDGNTGARTVKRSRLLEGSAVIAGADPSCTSLTDSVRAYTDPQQALEEAMDQRIRDALVARGLAKDATDNEALEFLERMPVAEAEPETAETTDAPEVPDEELSSELEVDDNPEKDEDMPATDAAAPVAADRIDQILAIDTLCRKHNISDDVRRGWMKDENMTAEKAALEVLHGNIAERSTGPAITPGVSEREKFYGAVESGLLSRMNSCGAINPDAVLARSHSDADTKRRNEDLKRSITETATQREFQYTTLPDIARTFLEVAGERVDGLPKQEIVRRAMAQQQFIERSDQATHTTGTFSNLLLDAANKTLLAGYDEADYTYTQWVRQAPSASDFKALNRVRFGEMADPDVVPENHEYPDKGTSDSKESYNVEKHGEIFSISFEAVVNDDLNAITRIPQMQGNAMRRKVNKVCYSILTANEALSDGVTLFHASSHGANLDGTALSEAALDVGYTVMMTQTGLSGTGTPLGIRPAYLIVPPGLAATAHRLVTGGVVPVTSGTTVPLYGDGRPRPLMVIEEAQLQSNSASAWYLAANSGTVETVEVTFLQGEETPVLTREEGFSTDTLKYKIRQTFNAKAIDFRGLYQGNA